VFDGSQPTQRERAMNYTDVEYACLVRAWRSVSLDLVVDNDQTRKMYWHRDQRPIFPMHASNCSHWSGCMKRGRNAPPSGVTVDDYVIFSCIILT
jgi:hypothetical protein